MKNIKLLGFWKAGAGYFLLWVMEKWRGKVRQGTRLLHFNGVQWVGEWLSWGFQPHNGKSWEVQIFQFSFLFFPFLQILLSLFVATPTQSFSKLFWFDLKLFLILWFPLHISHSKPKSYSNMKCLWKGGWLPHKIIFYTFKNRCQTCSLFLIIFFIGI